MRCGLCVWGGLENVVEWYLPNYLINYLTPCFRSLLLCTDSAIISMTVFFIKIKYEKGVIFQPLFFTSLKRVFEFNNTEKKQSDCWLKRFKRKYLSLEKKMWHYWQLLRNFVLLFMAWVWFFAKVQKTVQVYRPSFTLQTILCWSISVAQEALVPSHLIFCCVLIFLLNLLFQSVDVSTLLN